MAPSGSSAATGPVPIPHTLLSIISTPPASDQLPDAVTSRLIIRKYPYEVVHGGVMIPPEQLFALSNEPAWKDAKLKDTMAEYMRRAAEERGEDDAEAVELDSSKPLQLRCALPGKTPEEMNSILAQLQTMGLNATVSLEPATTDQVARECDRICAVAEEIAEHGDSEDPLGFLLDKLIALRNEASALARQTGEEMQPNPQSKQ